MRCPSCQRVYAAGEKICPKDGAPLLEPLEQALKRGPVALSQVAKLLDRVLGELEPLHATGRSHGKVHPGSVFQRQIGGEITLQLLSVELSTLPPPEYQPPSGLPGEAADLYSVGLLAHHLITGRPPSPGQRPKSLLGTELLQDVPEALDKLLAELFEPPGARPRRPSEVRARIANLELDSTVMGERLKAMRSLESTDDGPVLGAVVPSVADERAEAPTLPPPGPRSPSFGEGFSEDDAFADTWVRGLQKQSREAESDETVRPDGPTALPQGPRVPKPGASLDADTTVDPLEAATARGTQRTLDEPPASGPSWVVIIALGVVLGVGAGALYLWLR